LLRSIASFLEKSIWVGFIIAKLADKIDPEKEIRDSRGTPAWFFAAVLFFFVLVGFSFRPAGRNEKPTNRES
jgi:hypothetical protein